MIPILFDAAATNFDAAGLPLPDAVSCIVKQDSAAHSELVLQYPIAGEHFGLLKKDAIVLVKPDPYTRPQPFRIYKASMPINGLVSFSARHLCYDTLGIPVAPFKAATAAQAASSLISNALITCQFSLATTMTKAADMDVEAPTSLREALVSSSGSFLKTYGGALSFDRWTITHSESPGADRGVVISYGVDLVDFQQEENIADTYNGVLPYWKGTRTTTNLDGEITEQEQEVVLGAVTMAPGTWPVEKVKPVDFTEYLGDGDPPEPFDLTILGTTWITEHGVGVPAVSIRLKYADLGQDVRLFDTVTVDFSLLGVQTKAKVTAVTFDALNEIYTDVQVGDPRPELADSLMDASRLKQGTLPSARIGAGSIGGSQLATASVSESALAAYSVTMNRLANLSISNKKVKDEAINDRTLGAEAVTTPKIRGNAVDYDCLSLEVQQLFVDILEANQIFAGYIRSDGALVAAAVVANQVLHVAGYNFYPESLAIGPSGTWRTILTAGY